MLNSRKILERRIKGVIRRGEKVNVSNTNFGIEPNGIFRFT